MKICDLLKKDSLSLSFEVFPPKTDTAFESVKTATEKIAALRPAFMSVTYGAGGGTSAYTLDIAKNIKSLFGVPSIAHLTCGSLIRLWQLLWGMVTRRSLFPVTTAISDLPELQSAITWAREFRKNIPFSL